MGNCSGKSLSDVRDGFNNWFQNGLWAIAYPTSSPAYTWFQDVDTKLRDAFRRSKFDDCRNALPPIPVKPNPLTSATIPDLEREMIDVARQIAVWTDGITTFATCIGSAGSKRCERQMQKAMEVLKARNRAVSRLPNGGASSAQELCQRYSRWGRAWIAWGDAIAVWEEGTIECFKGICISSMSDLEVPLLPPDIDPTMPLETMQISPVPWPPWNGFDNDEPD